MKDFESYVVPEIEKVLSNRKNLQNKFNFVRNFSLTLAKPLKTEDYVIQSMPDVSPTKWHLAHTSWFFEAFVLKKGYKDYKSLHPQYHYLFNSYYVQAGERHERPKRGLLSRPTVKEVFEFREYIDTYMNEFFETADDKIYNEIAPVIEIGIHHEQQHQELILTDIKHVFSTNPLFPVYLQKLQPVVKKVSDMNWVNISGGLYEIGNEGKEFGYDNEFPQHKVFLESFKIGNRLVTNGEFLEFMEDKGYERAELWLSDGFAAVRQEKWNSPMYWLKKDNEWWVFSLTGLQKLDLNQPVCHVSHYEADAFARWKGARLPTEAEWEVAADKIPAEGNFVDDGNFHPVALSENADEKKLHQIYGDVWEWTQSAYLPYPGYKTLPGALGEYNGKFMSNQMVLRGGSCATSHSHIRKTYRNFFPPNARWQFMGFRLAKDIK